MSSLILKAKKLTGQTSATNATHALASKLAEGSYAMVGGRNAHSADASFADRQNIDVHVAAMKQAIGSKWQYVTRTDENGTDVSHPYFDPEIGEMVYPDDTGRVRSVNKQYLDKMLEIENYIEDKVDKIMTYAVVSEDMCKDILNLSDREYTAILAPVGAGVSMGDAARQKDIGMESRQMQELDGRIHNIKASPAGSISQTEKISKLRYVVRALRQRVAIRDLNRPIASDVAKAGPDIDRQNAQFGLIESNHNAPTAAYKAHTDAVAARSKPAFYGSPDTKPDYA